MIHWSAMRGRLNRAPAVAWAAGALAVLAALSAFASSPWAAVLMVAAAAASFWAAREARRFVIPEKAQQLEVVGLAELAPLLEALPDPALLVDAEGRIVSSNAAARRQMQFEARGQYLTSILRHPDVLEAVHLAVREG
ncbi:MAG TPA: PAS domain-containing protein, partial [Terricaulis sp.]|nr:PAS domain-containing protein [Terricaulis sp.]